MGLVRHRTVNAASRSRRGPLWSAAFLTIILAMMLHIDGAIAQDLTGASLTIALRRGGYVIVMRHASAPREEPDARTANADNTARERQLDAAGRTASIAMDEALRRLEIPINEVFTSPTYRARETVRLLGLANPTSVDELGDGGRSMQGVSPAQTAWLQKIVARVPAGNSLIVTHMPNIAAAFPQASAVADGESLIFRPDGRGGATIVARVRIEEWPRLP